MATSVLVVEDDPIVRRSIRRGLDGDRFSILEAESPSAAHDMLRTHEPTALLVDVNLGPESGLDFVEALRGEACDATIIVMTGQSSIEVAIEAMKRGADDYIEKPLSLEGLEIILSRALQRRDVRNRLNLFERVQHIESSSAMELVGSSPRWKQVTTTIDRLVERFEPSGAQPATVLLVGETGTGKQTLARMLHMRLAAEHGPFVHIRCYGLAAPSLERNVFGTSGTNGRTHEPLRASLFELPGGTIFLDEIAELPLELQSKLQAVLDRADHGTRGVQVIASTAHDLQAKVDQGAFRADLLYHLNTMTIGVPALRDRGDDAIEIAEAILRDANERGQRSPLKLDATAKSELRDYAWPGNVRELHNVLERASILTQGPNITATDLGLRRSASAAGADVGSSGRATNRLVTVSDASQLRFDFSNGPVALEAIERQLILEALRQARGNVSKAAKLIDMNRSSLRYRIERHKLMPEIEEITAS